MLSRSLPGGSRVVVMADQGHAFGAQFQHEKKARLLVQTLQRTVGGGETIIRDLGWPGLSLPPGSSRGFAAGRMTCSSWSCVPANRMSPMMDSPCTAACSGFRFQTSICRIVSVSRRVQCSLHGPFGMILKAAVWSE